MLPLPTGPIDPLMLRAAVRVYAPEIEKFVKSGSAPAYVVAAVEDLVSAFEKWGDETEAARNAAPAREEESTGHA